MPTTRPLDPLVRVKPTALPDTLRAWLDPDQAQPAGVVLVPFGARKRSKTSDWVVLLAGVVFVSIFSTMPIWLVGWSDGLKTNEWVVLVIGIAALGFQIWAVRELALTVLEPRKLDAGRWRRGCYLCDDGVLVLERGRATWLPVDCLTGLGRVTSPTGHVDFETGYVDNLKEVWLRWAWLQDDQEQRLAFARNGSKQGFQAVEAWARRRKLTR